MAAAGAAIFGGDVGAVEGEEPGAGGARPSEQDRRRGDGGGAANTAARRGAGETEAVVVGGLAEIRAQDEAGRVLRCEQIGGGGAHATALLAAASASQAGTTRR